MDYNIKETGVPNIQIRAIGDTHITAIDIPTGATLKVDGVEVI